MKKRGDAFLEEVKRCMTKEDSSITVDSGKGGGLGLEVAVARSVIEAQGGRIWTEAGTAGSLRVCMTLPTSAS